MNYIRKIASLFFTIKEKKFHAEMAENIKFSPLSSVNH